MQDLECCFIYQKACLGHIAHWMSFSQLFINGACMLIFTFSVSRRFYHVKRTQEVRKARVKYKCKPSCFLMHVFPVFVVGNSTKTAREEQRSVTTEQPKRVSQLPVEQLGATNWNPVLPEEIRSSNYHMLKVFQRKLSVVVQISFINHLLACKADFFWGEFIAG